VPVPTKMAVTCHWQTAVTSAKCKAPPATYHRPFTRQNAALRDSLNKTGLFRVAWQTMVLPHQPHSTKSIHESCFLSDTVCFVPAAPIGYSGCVGRPPALSINSAAAQHDFSTEVLVFRGKSTFYPMNCLCFILVIVAWHLPASGTLQDAITYVSCMRGFIGRFDLDLQHG